MSFLQRQDVSYRLIEAFGIFLTLAVAISRQEKAYKGNS